MVLTQIKTDLARGVIIVSTSYGMRHICKAVPGWKWSAAKKLWWWRASPAAAHGLLAAFCEVPNTDIDRPTQSLAGMAIIGSQIKAQDVDSLGAIPKTNRTPWNHQVVGYHLIKHQPATFLDWEMGTGKTKAVCDYVGNADVKRVLIACPNCVVPVWGKQFPEHCARPVLVKALCGKSVKQRMGMAQQAFLQAQARRCPAVLVINYDAIWRSPIAEWLTEQEWDLIVCDEIHRIKSPSGKASRFMHRLGRRAKKKVGLSGTPMPHSPLDVYGQYRFLDEGVFGTSYVRFRARYATMGGFGGHQILGYTHQDELHRKFYSIAHRVEKSEVLDLPPTMHVNIPVVLESKARRIYDQLEDTLIAEVEGGVVTAANALSRLLRLQQVTSGVVKTDDDEMVSVGTEKRAAFQELLGGLAEDEPVAVFVRFRSDLDAVHAAAEKCGRESVELSGRQKDIQGVWEDGPDSVAAIQIQAGGLGIDLTRACHVVFFSLGFSLGDYEQALARSDRMGQTRPVTYYHLVGEHTVDEYVYKALHERQQVVHHVLVELAEKEHQN